MDSMTCRICGGTLKEISSGLLKCECCDAEFQAITFEKQTELIKKLLDEQKQEELINCRKCLWVELNKPFLSSGEIYKWASEIKKLMPSDFLADFCLVLCSEDARQMAQFLDSIDEDKVYEYIEIVVKVIIKSLKKAHLLAMNNLIERAYKCRDINKYAELNSLLQKEADKVEEGVYLLHLPRDAFIAYSSKDMYKVNKLTEVLEDNGLNCFVAMRNLQHGSGAVENYDKALQTAMKNAKVFVFVSSSNSRDIDCDALTELNYIREYEPNKPRVEYLIEDYNGQSKVAESIVKDFFAGCEYCYTANSVAQRVALLRNSKRIEESEKAELEAKYKKQLEDANRKAEEERRRLTEEFNKLKAEFEKAREGNKKNDNIAVTEKAAVIEIDKNLSPQDALKNAKKYYNGDGVEKNYETAFQYFTIAADSGNAEAQCWVGWCYEKGLGVEQDWNKAAEFYKKAAEHGNAQAMNNLGVCYQNGKGVEQSWSKAIEYYGKAAESSNTYGQCNLGWCYERGFGVEQNYFKAFELYQKAAALGHAQAYNNLGWCYQNGNGIEQNWDKAIEYYKKGAEKGNKNAQCNIGWCYYNGKGVPTDYEKAVYWYKKASENGHAQSQNNLGLCYEKGNGVEQNYIKAASLYQQAAEQNNADAECNLGFLYQEGNGVAQNWNKAAELYERAAKHGNRQAMFNIGWCLENGKGIKKNVNSAIEWYRKAAAQGHENSRKALVRLGKS